MLSLLEIDMQNTCLQLPSKKPICQYIWKFSLKTPLRPLVYKNLEHPTYWRKLTKSHSCTIELSHDTPHHLVLLFRSDTKLAPACFYYRFVSCATERRWWHCQHKSQVSDNQTNPSHISKALQPHKYTQPHTLMHVYVYCTHITTRVRGAVSRTLAKLTRKQRVFRLATTKATLYSAGINPRLICYGIATRAA